MKQITVGKKEFRIENIKRNADLVYCVGRQAHLDLVIFFPGDSDVSASITIKLVGAGASAQILGFTLGKNEVNVNLETLQFHDAPKTTSNLLIKSLLKDRSSMSYDGRIVVSKKAHLTDAYQKNENLLLSSGAKAVSKPKLEILANDVRCTHGSTTGTIDSEGLWYLSSRGIREQEAEKLLTQGFFESAILRISDKIKQVTVRRCLWQII